MLEGVKSVEYSRVSDRGRYPHRYRLKLEHRDWFREYDVRLHNPAGAQDRDFNLLFGSHGWTMFANATDEMDAMTATLRLLRELETSHDG